MLRFIAAAFFVAALFACRPPDTETIDSVISLLKDNGFQIGERSEEQVIYIWAVDGVGIDVNGRHILIYEFADDEEAVIKGIEAAEKVLERGTGFSEFNRPAMEEPYHVKGKLLLFLGDHPDASRIKELVGSNSETGPSAEVAGGEQ